MHTYTYWYVHTLILMITGLLSDPQSRWRQSLSSPDPSLEPLELFSSYSQELVKHKAGKSRAGQPGIIII